MEMNGEIITNRDTNMRYIITNREIISLNQLVYGEIRDLLGWDTGQQQTFQPVCVWFGVSHGIEPMFWMTLFWMPHDQTLVDDWWFGLRLVSFFMLSWFNITYIATTSFVCSQGTCDFCHVSITFNIMVMFCQTLSRHRDLGRGELLLQTCWYHQPPVVRTTNGLALYFVATFTPSKRQFWDVRLGYILLLPDQSVLWLPLWVYTWQWILGEINQYHCGYKPCKLGYGCVRNMTALICI